MPKKTKHPEPLMDWDPMPCGSYYGRRLKDVPAEYLLALARGELGFAPPQVMAYIERSRPQLEAEVKASKEMLRHGRHD